MTIQEVIRTLKMEMLGDSEQMKYAKQTAIEALEKQIPKEPFEKEVISASMSGYKHKGICPKCSLTVSQFAGNYCQHCGQALDWSEQNG
jgi:hypothetical protein